MKDYISKDSVMSLFTTMIGNIESHYEEHKNDQLSVKDLKNMLSALTGLIDILPVKKVDDGTREDA